MGVGPLVLAAVLAVTGCGGAAPFVYDPAVYDREHPDFAKTPENLNSVVVCYSKYGSSQSDVARLAAQRCAQYGRGIRFAGNTYRYCPMLTPVGAEFLCTGNAVSIPAQAPITARGAGGRHTVSGGTPGQPGAPLAGFAEGERPMGILFGRAGGAAQSGTPAAPPPEAPLKPGGQ